MTSPAQLPWNVLISYHYTRRMDLAEEVPARFTVPPRVFADCGAFSAFTQDVVIDVHEYAEWCLRNARFFDVCASLDVIGSWEASHENFETLRGLGVDCIPVFHVDDPWHLFEQYCETEPYIALGGMVGNPGADRFIADCFERVADYPGVGFHGFGMTKFKQMVGYPWRSVDSTTWLGGARYGLFTLWDPGQKQLIKVQCGTPEVALMADLIVDHGGDPKVMYLGGRETSSDGVEKVSYRTMCNRLTATAWARMANVLLPDARLFLAGHAVGDIGVWDGNVAHVDPNKKNGF